jgi:hypothetical protein
MVLLEDTDTAGLRRNDDKHSAVDTVERSAIIAATPTGKLVGKSLASLAGLLNVIDDGASQDINFLRCVMYHNLQCFRVVC